MGLKVYGILIGIVFVTWILNIRMGPITLGTVLIGLSTGTILDSLSIYVLRRLHRRIQYLEIWKIAVLFIGSLAAEFINLGIVMSNIWISKELTLVHFKELFTRIQCGMFVWPVYLWEYAYKLPQLNK